MRTTRIARQIERRASTNWLVAPWAIRLSAGLGYFILFYVWYLVLIGMVVDLRSRYWHEFWTAPIRGGFSLLEIFTAVQIGWIALGAVDCGLLYFDRSAPFHRPRLFLNLLLILLWAAYLFIVHKSAMLFVEFGPA